MVPGSRQQQNVALNRQLKARCPDEQQYTAFRKLAQSYVAGAVSAQTLHDEFFRLYPLQHDLFVDLASLLPNSVLCNELLAVAKSSRAPSQTYLERAVETTSSLPAAPKAPVAPPASDVPIPDWILHDGVAPNSARAR